MFSAVLVANRGEIAVRIIRTLQRLGIRPVAVASIPDRTSLWVRSAAEHVLLEGYSAAETYLDVDAIIQAARATGCEAIHPGYGFLSERADFAERCAEAGLTFIGPPPGVLRGVGDKASARRLAVANDVPVVPGWDGADDDETLLAEADRVGFPLMLKARGGGGGRGMREVRSRTELAAAIESARREALAAFGDGGLLLEKLVVGAHHVEVQIMADTHGTVIHLGERDCSVQRRHQKLIEETPSPVVDEPLRQSLTAAAVRLARATGYVNAGTFEFLVGSPAESGRRPYYFLEVNPRLQVEHPVTEMVTGLDLVEWQLGVAAGEPLPLAQNEVRFEGHAIEFRVNAEDPRRDFAPSTGRIRSMVASTSRFDCGFRAGDVVPPQYDSLLGKAIVHGGDRAEALALAREGLARTAVVGVATNLALHRAVADSETFRSGDVTVDWLESAVDELLPAQAANAGAWAAAAVAIAHRDAQGAGPMGGAGWIGGGTAAIWLSDGDLVEQVTLSGHNEVRVGDGSAMQARLGSSVAGRIRVEVGDPAALFEVSPIDVLEGGVEVRGEGVLQTFWLGPPPPLPRRRETAAGGVTVVQAPLSGTVASVRASVGDVIEPGQVLAMLEAMKMEHRIVAQAAGKITSVGVRERDVVREGDTLFELE